MILLRGRVKLVTAEATTIRECSRRIGLQE
jgi:hypothetical protein